MVFCGRRVTTSINLPREQALLVEYNECIFQRLTGERATFQLRDFNHHVGLLVAKKCMFGRFEGSEPEERGGSCSGRVGEMEEGRGSY